MRVYHVFNIVWDKEVDGEEVDIFLPDTQNYDIPHGVDAEDTLCNLLTDNNGYCVRSFEYKLMCESKDYTLHFKQTVDGVDTDVARYWRSEADNYDHAVEQLKDHVERELGEKVTFVELLEVSLRS